MANSLISDTITEGIRIRAVARYVPEQSMPERRQYLFSYKITITNEGSDSARLVSRHWIIINADGDREDVHGPGVVGKTPRLAPRETFEYNSFCPLDTEWGTMEGEYQMKRDGGEIFDAEIGRFYLATSSVVEPGTV